jgi:hypothetical protein
MTKRTDRGDGVKGDGVKGDGVKGDGVKGDGVWRDPARLPLSELDRALATYSSDGQVDDPTGGDAGAEQEFGDEERLSLVEEGPDPDPDTEEGRRLRPSFEGHSGPS